MRDQVQSIVATNLFYAPQTTANLPVIPPNIAGGGYGGGTGIPADDNVTSTTTVVAAADQVILDIKVLVSINYATDQDLTLKLIGPDGKTTVTLTGTARGANFQDTIFDDLALQTIAQGNAPYTGHFRTTTAGALGTAFRGINPSGTWTLEIDDKAHPPKQGQLLSWGLQIMTRTNDSKAAQTGNLMDQNADGVGGYNPGVNGVGSIINASAPGDVYADPIPNPQTTQVYNGTFVPGPYDSTSLPLIVSGPHIASTFLGKNVGTNLATPTADNLLTDAVISSDPTNQNGYGLYVVFDRDMDPTTISSQIDFATTVFPNPTVTPEKTHVLRLMTPYGTFTNGQLLPDGSQLVLTLVPAPNANANNPDSNPNYPRTYEVVIQKLVLSVDATTGATTTTLEDFPQTISGSYSVLLTSDVQSSIGDPLDTNQNAGLEFLRGTASSGLAPVTYFSQAPVMIGTFGGNGQQYVSTISVPDSFLVQNLTLSINIQYPYDPDLIGYLVAPDGFQQALFTHVGNVGTRANFTNTVFTMSATTPIQNGGPPFQGSYIPQFDLSNFDNHFSAGLWELVIQDDSKSLVSAIGNIIGWSLTLSSPATNSGLGEVVADQATVGFRIFTQDPTNPQSSNTWTAIGPGGEGAKTPGGNAEVVGRVNATAVDPSDPSGNTVFVAAATGGIWKTTNFLTNDPSGPKYVPLFDNASTYGLNISSIAIFPRNNNPNQSIIFATTGNGDDTGDPNFDQGFGSRGIGFLRSMDGGQTWTLLDSRDNTLPVVSRDHFFLSAAGQTGLTSYKIVVDPTPLAGGNVIVYAALSDIDVNGGLVTTTTKGGIWRSLDSGNTWTLMLPGQATDVVLDLNNPNPTSGNVDTVFAAIRGQGVYRSPNRGQSFNLMTGTIGDPLIQNGNPPLATPVLVSNAGNGNTPNFLGGNALATGKIVLAKPNPEPSNVPGYKAFNITTEGWLYAAVVILPNGDRVTSGPNSDVDQDADYAGLYMTKDFGQNWVLVHAFYDSSVGILPTNGTTTPAGVANEDDPVTGDGTPKDATFHLGNFDLSMAVDANNPNVVYIGGTNEFTGVGLIRVDTTFVHDAHAFYLDNNAGAIGIGTLQTSPTSSGVVPVNPQQVAAITPPYDPYADPFINLIRDPFNPFVAGSTILVQNTAQFVNNGEQAKWISYDEADAPDPFADPSDPWYAPVRGIHQILTIQDPLTGLSRQIFATDNGVYTSVDDGSGRLVGPTIGNNVVVSGSRNGDLQIAQENQGAIQPSQYAAANSLLPGLGLIFATTRSSGIAQSAVNVENQAYTAANYAADVIAGVADPVSGYYGDLSYNVESYVAAFNEYFQTGVDRGGAQGLATQQNLPLVDPKNPTAPLSVGALYAYRYSEDLSGLDVRPTTDNVQVNDTGIANQLFLTSQNGDSVDPANWPFRGGYNLVVNPLNQLEMLISSQTGTVFATDNEGLTWAVIGNPQDLDGSNAQALAYGSPDVKDTNGVGNHNDYLFAGTVNGHIFVTFTGGGGNGNAWLPLSNGLDGSPVMAIVANPNVGSHEAYAVTQKGVYHMVDSSLPARGGSISRAISSPSSAASLVAARWAHSRPRGSSPRSSPTGAT